MDSIGFKHFFKVENNKIIFSDKEMLNFEKRKLEGKRGFLLFYEDEEKPSLSQYSYYFGVLIRKYCMNSNDFAAATQYDIHEYFLVELRGRAATIKKNNGRLRTIIAPGDFDHIRKSKKRFAEYITEVIALLNTDHDIFPLPPEHFKNPKYSI